MNIWLGKLDPTMQSLSDFENNKTGIWKRVRHPKAMQYMADVKKGDNILVYHSGEKQIVGVVEVLDNKPDPDYPRGRLVTAKFKKRFKEPFVTLDEVKKSGKFDDFGLVREPRLSFMPAPASFLKHFQIRI